MVPTFRLHIVEEYWEDALKFNPDRFGPGQKIKPFTYMPFMAGPRSCIGKNFAMLEMKIIVSQIIQNFEFSTHTLFQTTYYLQKTIFEAYFLYDYSYSATFIWFSNMQCLHEGK